MRICDNTFIKLFQLSGAQILLSIWIFLRFCVRPLPFSLSNSAFWLVDFTLTSYLAIIIQNSYLLLSRKKSRLYNIIGIKSSILELKNSINWIFGHYTNLRFSMEIQIQISPTFITMANICFIRTMKKFHFLHT